MLKLLDHGYIKLIQTWGSDEQIIEAARMSTDKGFLGWGPLKCEYCDGLGNAKVRKNGKLRITCPKCKGDKVVPGDEKLLAYLWNNKHCYDEQTEVLTDRGFIKWSAVNLGDKLGQLDESTQSLVYEEPFELITENYQGKMYQVDHGGVDLLVTPNHKMYVKRIISIPKQNKQCWSHNWKLISALDLCHKSMIRYRKHAVRKLAKDVNLSIFPPYKDKLALLKLIGFFIGDGNATGSRINDITFHLKKVRKIEFLKQVCQKIGWEFRSLKSDTYSVKSNNIAIIFRNHFYNANQKCIPKYLLDLNKDEAIALLDGLKNSDGSVKRGTWEYTSTSKQVIESLQLLVLHAGGACHINYGNYIYRASILSRMTEPIINQSKRNTKWIDYNGKIFCARTRTGILVIRRNGKIVLSGNSTPFEMAGATIEVQAPIFVFREWHRHRSQSYNELSARYTPMPNKCYIPTKERMLISGDGNKQAGTIKDAKVLDEKQCVIWLNKLDKLYYQAERVYQNGLKMGVPKELARLAVTVSRYSRMRASANLRNWLAFLTLRQDKKAQYEIRVYADALYDILLEKFPRTCQLFKGN